MSGGPTQPRRLPWADFIGLVIALAVVVAFFAFATDRFFTVTNLRTVANQIPADIVIATGMTFVLVSGGIDLSVGSVFALCGAIFGVAMANGWPLPLALLAGIGGGLACGALNGAVIVRWRVPSFIVTLGMLEAARGATYLLTESRTQYLGQDVEWLARSNVFGITIPIITAVVVVAAAHAALTQTVFGRRLFATGQNEETARLSGIATKRVRFAVFALAGALAGLAAILHTARLAATDPNAGIGLELDAIAAVVIGDTSLSGGRGSVLRTVMGVLIIAALGSGLAQANVQEPVKRLITGAVIVVAVILDQLRKPTASA